MRQPQPRILLKRAHHESLEGARDRLQAAGAQRRHGFVEMPRHDHWRLRTAERGRSGEHLVEHDADAVEIRRGRRRLATDDLGRDILRRSRDRAR